LLLDADDPAIGVALGSDADTFGGITYDRRGRIDMIALSRPRDRATKDAPSTFVLEHLGQESLEPLRDWLAGASGKRPPYLVLHDAHADLTALTELGLEPVRFGSTLIASTLIAEGADSRHDRRSLGECVAEKLHHSLEPADMTWSATYFPRWWQWKRPASPWMRLASSASPTSGYVSARRRATPIASRGSTS
jgi:hypothetical protein